MPSQPRETPRKKVLRGLVARSFQQEKLGFEAYVWAAHRITGLLMLIFLVFHLLTLSSIFKGADAYDQVLRSMERPLFKIGEILLLWVIAFHVLNGIRLILFNFSPTINHKRFAYSIALVSLALAFLSIPFVF
jgi:succinate dehydrogenase / fumarate reductase cytochrome b subunit